jgi:uncharacterized caspase-like protein
MRAVGAIVLAFSLSLLFAQPASAAKRVALVIGNSGYQKVARLDNPANDAAAMTEVLKGAGFDLVESRRDLNTSEMRRALRDFSDKARDADVAVVYYAGHGIEVDGANYLIPVDAVLERDIDIYDEAFALDRILVTIEPAKQLRLVILDACRDNPFAKSMKRTSGSRAVGRGLAKIEPNSPNTLIAYASKAGSTASDGDSKNSPFTAALVKHIAKPGLDLRKAFGFVRDDVLKNTSNRQEPYVYGSLGGDDVPLVPGTPVVSAAPNPNSEVRRDYELALQIGTREVWTAFLAQHSEGLYATLAKGQLSKVASEEARVAATNKARQAEEETARLRAGGAQQAEQAKAAARAKAAEDARIAAEKAKQIQLEQVAAAEQARVAAEKLASERAETTKVVTAARAAAKVDDEKPAAAPAKPDQHAALQPANPQGYQRIAARFDGSPNADASLSAARDELLAIVIRGDRAALNKRVGKTFFWDSDHGGGFNSKHSATRNLAAATTWESLRSMLSADAATPRRSGSDDYCMPARGRPQDAKQLERVAEQLNVDTFFDWGIVMSERQPVRATGNAAAAEIGVLSRELVRVTEWTFDTPAGQPRWVEVLMPAGAKGFVDGRYIQTLAPERLCLRKDKNGAWQISGYIGGGD